MKDKPNLFPTTWVAILVLLCMIVLLIAVGATIQTNVRLKEELQNKTELIKAHNAILDRIYADHPSYIDDVLSETDEYCDLTERELREKRVWKGK